MSVTEARKKLLSMLKTAAIDESTIRQAAAQEEKDHPDLWLRQPQYPQDIEMKDDPIDWNIEYFDTLAVYTEYSFFCRENFEHLIEIRQHLQSHGVVGFACQENRKNGIDVNIQKKDSDFEPSDILRRSVDSGDLLSVRTALHLELNNNRLTTEVLNTALQWVKKNKPDLFDCYEENVFAESMQYRDPKHWSRDYYGRQGVYLTANYSEERLKHLIDVRDYLRQKNVEGFIPLPPKNKTHTISSTHTNPYDEKSSLDSDEHSCFEEIVELIAKWLESTRKFLADVSKKIRPNSHDKR